MKNIAVMFVFIVVFYGVYSAYLKSKSKVGVVDTTYQPPSTPPPAPETPPPTKPAPATSAPAVTTPSGDVTLAMYQRMNDGISYREARAIVGRDGEEVSRNKIDGVPGVVEPVVTVTFNWKNKDGTRMALMFQNDKLVQRSEFGLK